MENFTKIIQLKNRLLLQVYCVVVGRLSFMIAIDDSHISFCRTREIIVVILVQTGIYHFLSSILGELAKTPWRTKLLNNP